MPRLTNHVYLQQYRQLRDALRGDGTNAMFLLKPTEQWDLFAYFLPHEHFSDEQRLVARAQVTAFDSSLPQRAGRAWAQFKHAQQELEEYRARIASEPPQPKQPGKHRLVVRSEVNPDLEPEDLAKILVLAATEQARQEREAGVDES